LTDPLPSRRQDVLTGDRHWDEAARFEALADVQDFDVGYVVAGRSVRRVLEGNGCGCKACPVYLCRLPRADILGRGLRLVPAVSFDLILAAGTFFFVAVFSFASRAFVSPAARFVVVFGNAVLALVCLARRILEKYARIGLK